MDLFYKLHLSKEQLYLSLGDEYNPRFFKFSRQAHCPEFATKVKNEGDVRSLQLRTNISILTLYIIQIQRKRMH
jgi:hypothetical protein